MRADAIIVSGDGNAVDAIVSERDVAYGLAEHGADLLNMTAAELMKLMTRRRIRHLPVVENSKLVGAISIGEIVRHRLSEMQLDSDIMRDYAISKQ